MNAAPKKILFDHLPKCGGSTLNGYLWSNYPKNRIFSIDGTRIGASVRAFRQLPQNERFAYDLIIGHCADRLIADADPACLKITMLRDPVHRIVSHYYYARRKEDHYLHQSIISSDMTLEAYATSELSDELHNWYTSHFSGLSRNEVESDPDAAVALAVKNLLERYDLIGFMDDFDGFVERLKVMADLPKAYNRQKANVSHERPSFDEIPQDVLMKIAHTNALDLRVYEKARKAADPHAD